MTKRKKRWPPPTNREKLHRALVFHQWNYRKDAYRLLVQVIAETCHPDTEGRPKEELQ